jgi:uncharacterized membrane protein
MNRSSLTMRIAMAVTGAVLLFAAAPNNGAAADAVEFKVLATVALTPAGRSETPRS